MPGEAVPEPDAENTAYCTPEEPGGREHVSTPHGWDESSDGRANKESEVDEFFHTKTDCPIKLDPSIDMWNVIE